MADIRRILNKTSWTGRELGRLELTNMAVTFKQNIDGEPVKPLFMVDQFREMLSTLKDKKQLTIYNGYIAIHEWVSLQYRISSGYYQSLQLQLKTLKGYLSEARIAEDVYIYLAKKGYPYESEIADILSASSLEMFFPEAERHEYHIKRVEDAVDRTLTAYYALQGYNLALDMTAKRHSVPELTAFKMDLNYIDKVTMELNAMIESISRLLNKADYQDKIFRAKKIQALNELFPILDYGAIEIPAENIAEASELVKDFRAYYGIYADRFYRLLCTRTKEAMSPYDISGVQQ